MPALPTRALLVMATAACLSVGDWAAAQCATCPQPTVAYSPVVAPVPAVPVQPIQQVAYQPVTQPVVLQQAPPARTGWYPGKWIGNLFRPRTPAQPLAVAPVGVAPAPVAQPTFVTAAYRPTFPPSYTTYSVAPTVQTVARPVALASVASPTYAADPCCSTSYRPVTLTAASPCCDPCSACSTCSSGVTTASFTAPASPGCSSCAQSTVAAPPASTYTPPPSGTPTPALPPNAPVSPSRVNRPESEPDPNGYSPADNAPAAGDGDQTWWDAPQLFDGGDRSAARRPTTNVWNAVYQQPANQPRGVVQRTSYRPATPQAPAKHTNIGASDWRSAP